MTPTVDGEAIDAAASMIKLQLGLAGISDQEGAANYATNNTYIQGYIFGFCDSFFQARNVKDQAEMTAYLTLVYIKLFGKQNGSSILGQSIRNQTNDRFAEARMRGGQEFVYFVQTREPPFGLSAYITGAHKRKPAQRTTPIRQGSKAVASAPIAARPVSNPKEGSGAGWAAAIIFGAIAFFVWLSTSSDSSNSKEPAYSSAPSAQRPSSSTANRPKTTGQPTTGIPAQSNRSRPTGTTASTNYPREYSSTPSPKDTSMSSSQVTNPRDTIGDTYSDKNSYTSSNKTSGHDYRPGTEVEESDLNISGDNSIEMLLSKFAPKYPDRALDRRIEGHVELEFTVTASGDVINPKVISSTHSMFEKSAIRAAKKFKYKPRIVNGQAVEANAVRARITYKLADD